MVAVDLIYNLALLVALSAASGFIQRQEDSLRSTAPLQGLLFGFVAIIGMLHPLVVEEGVIFDGRSVVISLCGFFFGPVAVAVSVIMAMICRVLQGGAGALTGVLTILTSGGIGLAFHYFWRIPTREPSVIQLLGLGLLVHVVMLFVFLTLPVVNVLGMIAQLALPILVTYPLATVLIGRILSDQQSRRRVMKALWKSNQELETTLYSIGDAVICTDREARVQRINSVAEHLTGWKEEEARGRALGEVFPIISEETGEEVKNPAFIVLEEGRIVGLANHTLLISRDGTERPIADSAAPIRDAGGQVSGVVLVFRDQSAERAAEDTLRANEARYRTLFKANPHPMWVYDMATLAFLEVNEAAVQQYGYSRDEFLAMTIADIRPEEDVARLRKAVEDTPRDAVDEAGEWVHRRKDGSEIIVEITSHVIEFDGREAELVLANDVTARRRAEEELRERYEFERLVSSLSSRFVGGFAPDDAIDETLAELGRFAGADRAYVIMHHDDVGVLDNTHEWCAEGVRSEKEDFRNVPSASLPWLMKNLQPGTPLQIRDRDDLPPEAAAEKEVMEAQDIKSLLHFPLRIGGKAAGYVGFDSVHVAGEWTERQIRSLDVFAGLLSNALGRRRMEEALQE